MRVNPFAHRKQFVAIFSHLQIFLLALTGISNQAKY
jgi:hypothetical protein